MTQAEADLIESMLLESESTFGLSFPAGRSKHVRFMAHVFEPLRVLHKPLVFYVAVHVLATTVDLVVTCMGFKRC